MKNLIIATFTLAASLACNSAEINFLGTQNRFSFLHLDGPIQTGDLGKLETEFARIKSREGSTSMILMLSSMGGNVDEAMRIGDFIEKNEIGTMVLEKFGICVSACVFILAAGDHKTIKGKVGIHRPYVSDVSIGGEQGAKTLGQYLERIKAYLDSKGISPSLAEDMFSIPPEKVRYLSPEEISRYRLDQTNYLKQEATDIETAKSLGLTRQEYGARKNQMNRECGGMPHAQMMACINRIMGTNLK